MFNLSKKRATDEISKMLDISESLIWARRTEGSYWTGMRYLVIQIASGVILIAGVSLYYYDTGSIAFERMELGSVATWLIFLSFGIKCAFPLLHNWLQDSYLRKVFLTNSA